MRYFFWAFVLLALSGCNKERIVDIATPDEILQKDVLLIFPSIPEQFCYADHVSEVLNDFSSDIDGKNAQTLWVDRRVECSTYGYTQCSVSQFTSKSQKSVSTVECLSDDGLKKCLYFVGEEYRDAEGETFDASCIMGVER